MADADAAAAAGEGRSSGSGTAPGLPYQPCLNLTKIRLFFVA